MDGAVLADLSEVISEEVGDHDEFCAFFFGCLQFDRGGGVLLRVGGAGSGAFDWAGFDLLMGKEEEGFGRRGQNLASVEVVVGCGGCGCGGSKFFVEIEEAVVVGEGGSEAS